MDKYIVIDSGSDASRLMFHDITKLNNAIEVSNIYEIANPVLKLLCKVHNSGKINRKLKLPFRRIWNRYCVIEQAKRDTINNYVVVMTNVSVKKLPISYLQDLKKYPNIYLIMIAVDSFVDDFLSPIEIMKQIDFNLIYSFDKQDCEKYGLLYSQSQYSKIDNIKSSSKALDLFFIGRAKHRLSVIQQIARDAQKEGIVCGFYILDVPTKLREEIEGITYIDSVITYKEVLPVIANSKCLLDIVQDGQVGYTTRVYETIFYNKLLLTNNKSVIDFSYYNAQYIKIFDRPENIDYSFIKAELTVDYKYNEEFSPIALIDDIRARLFGGKEL